MFTCSILSKLLCIPGVNRVQFKNTKLTQINFSQCIEDLIFCSRGLESVTISRNDGPMILFVQDRECVEKLMRPIFEKMGRRVFEAPQWLES